MAEFLVFKVFEFLVKLWVVEVKPSSRQMFTSKYATSSGELNRLSFFRCLFLDGIYRFLRWLSREIGGRIQ